MPEHTDRMADALEAVLMFHSAAPWTRNKSARWLELTGSVDATTSVLCNFVREVCREVGIAFPEQSK